MPFCPCCAQPTVGRRAVLRGLVAGATTVAADRATAGPIDDALRWLVSPEQERELGLRTFAQIKREVPRSRDAGAQRRLQAVGARIVQASGSSIPVPQWEFVVFQGSELNAFALPGGKVGFFEGMLELTRDDSRLATVLGHEVAHVNARHAAERIGAAMVSSVGTSVLGWALGLDPSSGIDRLASAVIGAGTEYGVMRPFGRSQELEADRLGLGYMACAGFDPQAALGFWEAMARAGGDKPPAFLSTHPSDTARIAQLRSEIPPATARVAAGRC